VLKWVTTFGEKIQSITLKSIPGVQLRRKQWLEKREPRVQAILLFTQYKDKIKELSVIKSRREGKKGLVIKRHKYPLLEENQKEKKEKWVCEILVRERGKGPAKMCIVLGVCKVSRTKKCSRGGGLDRGPGKPGQFQNLTGHSQEEEKDQHQLTINKKKKHIERYRGQVVDEKHSLRKDRGEKKRDAKNPERRR